MDLTTQKLLMGSSELLDPNTGITWSNVNYASLNNPDIWANNQMTRAVVTAGNSLVIGGTRGKMAVGGADAYTDPFNVYTAFKALGTSDNNVINILQEGGNASHNYYQSISHTPNGTAGLTSGLTGTLDDSGTVVTLPFSVNFFGVSYSKITINSNGLVYFGDTAVFNPTAIGFFNEARSIPHILVCRADLIQNSLHTGTVGSKFVVRIGGYNYPDQPTITHLYELHFYSGANYVDLHIVTAPSAETEFSGWQDKLAAATGFNQVGGACASNVSYANYATYNTTQYPIQFFTKSGVSYRLHTVSVGTAFTPGTGTLFAQAQYSTYGALSTDGGYNWRLSGYNGGLTTVHYDGKKYLSFALYNAGDSESIDAGNTWTGFSPRTYAWDSSVTFATEIFSAASQTLLFAAGGDMQGVYTAIVSSNGGQTWTNIKAGLGALYTPLGSGARYISGTAWNGTEFLVFFTAYSGNVNVRIVKYSPTSNTWTDLGVPIGSATGYGTVSAGEITAAYTSSYYDGTALYRSGPYGILRSTNSTTWAKVQGGSGFNQTFKYNGVWVGIASSYGGYATSSDGINWTQTNTSKSYDFDAGHLSGRTITASAYNGSQYIIGGDTGRCSTSTDGMTWTNRSGLYNTVATSGGTNGPNPRAPFQFMWDGSRWWAAREYNHLSFSTDNAATWTALDLYGQWGQNSVNTIAYGNGIYVIGGGSGKISTSTTTGNAYATVAGWTAQTGLQTAGLGTGIVQKIIYDSDTGRFIAAAGSGVGISSNGIDWQYFTNPTWGVSCNDIVKVNPDVYVIVGDSAKVGKVTYSGGGLTWDMINSYIYNNMPNPGPLTKVAYNGWRLITTSNTSGPYLTSGGRIFYSDDLGTTWTDAKLMDSGWFDDQYYGYSSAVRSLTVGKKKKFLITGTLGRISHSPYEIADKPQRVISEQFTSGNSFAAQIQSTNFNAANNNLIQKNDFVVVFVRCDDSTATIGLSRYNNGYVDSVTGLPQVTVSGRQASRVFYTQIAKTNGLEYFTASAGVSTQNLEMRVVVYRPGAGNKLIVFGGSVTGTAGFVNTVTTQTLQNAFQDGVILNFISGYYATATIGTASYTQPAGTTKFGTDTQFSSASEVYRTSRVINQTFTWTTNNAYMGATSIALRQY